MTNPFKHKNEELRNRTFAQQAGIDQSLHIAKTREWESTKADLCSKEAKILASVLIIGTILAKVFI